MVQVAAFLIAPFGCCERAWKPFNPLLGETFELEGLGPNKDGRFLAEQVRSREGQHVMCGGQQATHCAGGQQRGSAGGAGAQQGRALAVRAGARGCWLCCYFTWHAEGSREAAACSRAAARGAGSCIQRMQHENGRRAAAENALGVQSAAAKAVGSERHPRA